MSECRRACRSALTCLGPRHHRAAGASPPSALCVPSAAWPAVRRTCFPPQPATGRLRPTVCDPITRAPNISLFCFGNKAAFSKGTKRGFQRSKSKGLDATPHSSERVMGCPVLSCPSFWFGTRVCLPQVMLCPCRKRVPTAAFGRLWKCFWPLDFSGIGQRPHPLQEGSLSLSPPSARLLFAHSQQRTINQGTECCGRCCLMNP